MTSNQIAWGIVKAVVILAVLFFIGLPVFGVSAALVLVYITAQWRDLLSGVFFLIFIFGLMKLTLLNPVVAKNLNDDNSLPIVGLYLVGAAGAVGIVGIIIGRVLADKPLSFEGLILCAAAMVLGFHYMFKIAKKQSTNNSKPNTSNTCPTIAFNFDNRTWVPTAKYEALYCEKCRKKIGMYGWKNEEHFICSDCHKGLN